MKREKGSLPTSATKLREKLLKSNKEPEKFQKVSRNKKQKQMIIGSIIILLLLVGGLYLYKTYALYEEKKEFNVLKGLVSNFAKIKTIAEVNGVISATIPTKEEGYEITNVSCDKGSTGKWDKEKWQVVVENPTNKEITCTVTFLNSDFKKLVEIIGSNAKNMNELLKNTSDVDKIVVSKDAMQLIVNSKKLPSDIKESENYTIEVRKKFLSSTVVSEEEKYNVGLPCYLYNNLVNHITNGYNITINSSKPQDSALDYYNNSLRIYASWANSNITIVSKNKINTSDYQYIDIPSYYWTNRYPLVGTLDIGLNTDSSINFDPLITMKFGYIPVENAPHKTFTIDLTDYKGEFYLKFKLTHEGQFSDCTVYVCMENIALY